MSAAQDHGVQDGHTSSAVPGDAPVSAGSGAPRRSAAKRQELEARTAEAVEFAGQVARQLDGCRERANAAEVEISRLKATLDFIATDATITPEGCPEPWRSTLIEWAQAANHALRTACTCDPEAYEVGPERRTRDEA